MPRYLCLSATLLTSRYHPEHWPPAPARAFQALIAGVMTGGYRKHWPACETAFQWLEQLPPPDIYARSADRSERPYRIAVPNNDFDAVAREWKKGTWSDPARVRTLKDVQPSFLPHGGPHVHYVWNVEREPPTEVDSQANAISTAAEYLHTLGWGVDMAFGSAALRDEVSFPAFEHWEAAPFGPLLMDVPVPGFLADLKDCYARFLRRTSGAGVDPNTRPTVIGSQSYRRRGEAPRPLTAFRLVKPDPAAGTERPYARPPHDSMKVAAWLRHAAGNALQGWRDQTFLNEYVLGHVESGDRSNRLSYVPLPSVGHRHVDGWIRRAAIVEPHGASGEVSQAIRRMLPGKRLFAEGIVESVCALAPARESEIDLYLRKCRAWRSVTPVVLHGFNTQHRRVSLVKTEKLLLEALAECGYPADAIRGLNIQPAPLVAGAVGARDVQVPAHLSKWPRYHVRVEFQSKVSGPVLVGIGRHYGIGLFLAED